MKLILNSLSSSLNQRYLLICRSSDHVETIVGYSVDSNYPHGHGSSKLMIWNPSIDECYGELQLEEFDTTSRFTDKIKSLATLGPPSNKSYLSLFGGTINFLFHISFRVTSAGNSLKSETETASASASVSGCLENCKDLNSFVAWVEAAVFSESDREGRNF